MEASAAPTPDRSRRVYVWWGAGFVFLALLAAFCWLVVTPTLEVRRATARACAECHPPVWRPEDVRALGGPQATIAKIRLYLRLLPGAAPDKPEALGLLALCGRDAVPTLVSVLESEHSYPLLRLAAVQALGDLGEEAGEAVPALVMCVREAGRPEDRETHLAYQAVYALGRIGPAARMAIPDILDAARWESNATVAEALGNVGVADPGVLDFLIAGLDHQRYPQVFNAEAARALGRLGPAAAPAASELARLLANSKDAAVRAAVVEALRSIAPNDDQAWMQLCDVVLEEGNDHALRLSAAQALARIGRLQDEMREHQIEMLEDALKVTAGPARAAVAEALAKVRSASDGGQ